MSEPTRLVRLDIDGYRPFREFSAHFGDVEVLVGANGSGKSSLFEFLRFLRDAVDREIPPEIVAGPPGRHIFHVPGPERFSWQMCLAPCATEEVDYCGSVSGPAGRISVKDELVSAVVSEERTPLMSVQDGRVRLGERGEMVAFDLATRTPLPQRGILPPWNVLALSTATSPDLPEVYALRRHILGWRFYSAFNIADEKIRRPAVIEQEPMLREDAGNLSSVLFHLMTEHRERYDELVRCVRGAIPAFAEMNVKARGGPGEVMAFWREEGSDTDLSLADLSDGILRFLCWTVLCVTPNPPTLVCIDEPDLGVHPRTLPILAGLFEKASERTQFLLATHASYFLSQFDISRIAVMRKHDGRVEYRKPKDSEALTAILEEFGPQEVEALHVSDELERLS